ncbi:Hpt domain-containing protein [Belliella kenyensis]|uniref:Hpt domain-containing protein n=1 Tax=Belliella kenyensis TaxID=1472724 RepID=A0ABV8EKA1_9BACT|nr:Hpt domain-containing protein [Belliella kenyensis]MCH7400352.1 Hpt domain-containing protein [Belliella kenyensis]MDN3604630.1 Hpt domain-containing protein [Belliella kenyensis]
MYQIVVPQTIFQFFGEDDVEMIKEMVQIIIDTNIQDLKKLDEFYNDENYDLIKRKCHKAKPSMSYIGAIQTRKLLESIEEDLENSQSTYELLKSDLEIIEKELKEFLNTL